MSYNPPPPGGFGGDSGRSCGKKVGRSANNRGTLFVGDTSSNCTSENLRALFSLYGEVLDIRIMKARRDSSSSLGYGFVTMGTERSARAAIEGLNGYELLGRRLRVNFAEYGRAGQHDGSHTIQSLHVKFQAQEVDVRTDEVKIREIFSAYGDIADVSIKKSFVDKETQLHNGYGFVHFRSFKLPSLEEVVASIAALSSLVVDRVLYTVEASNNMKNVVNPGSGGASTASSSNSSVNNSPNAGDRKSVVSTSTSSVSPVLSYAERGPAAAGSQLNMNPQNPYTTNFIGGYNAAGCGVAQSPIEGMPQLHPSQGYSGGSGQFPGGRVRAASVGSGGMPLNRNGVSDFASSPIEMSGRIPTNGMRLHSGSISSAELNNNRYPYPLSGVNNAPHPPQLPQRGGYHGNDASGTNRAELATGSQELLKQKLAAGGVEQNGREFAAHPGSLHGHSSQVNSSASGTGTVINEIHQASGGGPGGVLMPQRTSNQGGNRNLDSGGQSSGAAGCGSSLVKPQSDMINAWKMFCTEEGSVTQKAEPVGVSGGDWFIGANGDSQYKLWAGDGSEKVKEHGTGYSDGNDDNSIDQHSLAVRTGSSSNNSSSYSSSTIETGSVLTQGSFAGDSISPTVRNFPFRSGSASNNSSNYTFESVGLQSTDPNSSSFRTLPNRSGSSSNNCSAYSTIESGGMHRSGSFPECDFADEPKQLEIDVLRQQQEKFMAMQLQMEREQYEQRMQLQQMQMQQYGTSFAVEHQRGLKPGVGAEGSELSSETTTPVSSITPSPYEQPATLPYNSNVGGHFMHSAGPGNGVGAGGVTGGPNYKGASWEGGNGNGNRNTSYRPALFTSPIQLDSKSGQSHQNSYVSIPELQQQQQMQMLQEQQHHNFPPHQHQIRLRGNRRIRGLEQNPAPVTIAPPLPLPPQAQELWQKKSDTDHHRHGDA